jgi:hypothetical protein
MTLHRALWEWTGCAVVAVAPWTIAVADDIDTSLPPSPMSAPRAPPAAAGPAPTPEAGLATTTRVPYAPEALLPAESPSRSTAVDRANATRLSARRDDFPTFSLFVQGERGERPAQPMTLERRFSAALGTPQPSLAARLAGNALDTQPCSALSSPGTPFGAAYNPYGFCP